jgi:probable F420-dependent oxidoreductase
MPVTEEDLDTREAGTSRHFGVVLPNYGRSSSPAEIRRTAAAAEELGFLSVWATEHIIVGPDGVDRYVPTFDPFVTLSWIAGWTHRVELGTSILLVPLHNPIHVAKQVATLTELTGRRFRLGVGAGWHEDEFRFMGMGFADRGRRLNEGVRLMRALWSGERSFSGDYWQLADATFSPFPSVQPEIWVGGVSPASISRIELLGDATWHPSFNVDMDFVRRIRHEHPEIRVVPRTTPDLVDDFLELGADGAIVSFPDEASMTAFAAKYL